MRMALPLPDATVDNSRRKGVGVDGLPYGSELDRDKEWHVTDRSAPTWLDEPCPPWCARVHQEQDHPEDRYHQSEPSIFTGVAGAGDQVPVTASLRPLSLGIRLGRHVGDAEVWLAIETLEAPHPRLVLTETTAQVLLQRLDQQLAHL